MSAFQHSYGPTCRLRPSSSSKPASTDTPPPLNAHFFYSASLSIDDSLSPLPTRPATNARIPARPFSALDNAALEEAWQGLLSREDVNTAGKGTSGSTRKRPADVSTQGESEGDLDGGAERETTLPGPGKRSQYAHGRSEVRNSPLAREGGWADTGQSQRSRRTDLSVSESERKGARADSRPSTPIGIDHPDKDGRPSSPGGALGSSAGKESSSPYGASPLEKSTTGTPFLRAPSRRERIVSPARPVDFDIQQNESPKSRRRSLSVEELRSPGGNSLGSRHAPTESLPTDEDEKEVEKRLAEVPVGITRLHFVTMPELQMEPIYWSTLQDTSPVTRGTWFYKDNMLPVEADLANQLESGYAELKVWTETWSDELNSAIRVGAEGEEKVLHRIWPEEDAKKGQSKTWPSGAPDASDLRSRDSRSDILQASGTDEMTTKAAEGLPPQDSSASSKRFANSHVIYANAKEAFILKPSLIPSAYYGRRPLAKIRKGTGVGVAVVRGFDWKKWNWLHPPQESTYAVRADEIASMSRSGAADFDRRKACRACLAQQQTQKVTDLVLVIHGIGQQLSKRIESFAFTHAINSFRRQIHVELGKYGVQGHLRKDVGGIMALPINWRSTLSFEDGGPPPTDEDGEENPSVNHFNLKDITPETIPAIRNLVSDVMLDIPYYLSHHKPKMVEAVIKEANRVFRLWCLNNPGFEEHGRVHLIAHSLGSAMALDILSKQPTKLPKELDPTSTVVNDQHFNFDTTNLFLCGSPAGFFLLLNRATLLPRRGRNKPGADDEDVGEGITGEPGTYGCLAIDNLYNVMSFNDPVAYRLNAAVDKHYASSLKPAVVPSASTTLFSSFGAAFKSFTPGGGGAAPAASALPATTITTTGASSSMLPSTTAGLHNPSINTARLPSNVEMETHNFTHEEMAEKRMYLMNDNGQIDYFLSSGGGPLEIQYLNMLGAHSSYWISRDFVRFLVVEVGRAQGREWTLPSMRPVKRERGVRK
ncbi:MAG: S23-interacting protein [Sclerophora amabilis]|nr:MAG: S23-interacting protein [Sclerophora amabilis]